MRADTTFAESSEICQKISFAKADKTATAENMGVLLTYLAKRMKLKNDAALARKLKVAPPVLSKIRHRKLSIGSMLAIRMHEESGISIAEIVQILTGQLTAEINAVLSGRAVA